LEKKELGKMYSYISNKEKEQFLHVKVDGYFCNLSFYKSWQKTDDSSLLILQEWIEKFEEKKELFSQEERHIKKKQTYKRCGRMYFDTKLVRELFPSLFSLKEIKMPAVVVVSVCKTKKIFEVGVRFDKREVGAFETTDDKFSKDPEKETIIDIDFFFKLELLSL